MKLFKKPPPIIIGLIIIAVIVSGFLLFSAGSDKSNHDLVVAERKNLVREVNVTGRVKPLEEVNLAFERSGKITRIYAEVGDRITRGVKLIELDNAEFQAQLNEAEAALKIQLAGLEELRRGARPEEIQVYEARVMEAQQNLLNSLEDAYTKSDDAIRNKADQIISNPRSSDPQIIFYVNDVQLETDIENGRVRIETVLIPWAVSVIALVSSNDLAPHINTAKENLGLIKTFLEKLALAVNATNNSTYRTDVSTARTNVNTAINNLRSAEASLLIQERELALKRSGTPAEEIAAQEAQVEQTRASVANIQAQLAKTILRSPINGIIAELNAKIGEIIPLNTPIVSVIASGLKIEADIPEFDIAEIKVGDRGTVTFDAYSDDIILEIEITAIDPAETIIEGVPTYKTAFQFINQDARIKSGMTADILLITDRRENVIVIPLRAVIKTNGKKIVRVLNNVNAIEEIEVETGLQDSLGNVEIIQGITEGERVIIFLAGR